MERICWNCKHLFFIGATPGYSEVTPGGQSELRCEKQVFGETCLEDIGTMDELRNLLSTAKKCEKFEPRTSDRRSDAG